METKEQYDLDEFINDFLAWQKVKMVFICRISNIWLFIKKNIKILLFYDQTMKNLSKENSNLKMQLNIVQNKLLRSEIAEKTANESSTHLREMVDKLQSVLDSQNKLQDENATLKREIANAKQIAVNVEKSHKSQIDEAVMKLEACQQANTIEVQQMKENLQQQHKRKISLLEQEIQSKNEEIRQLNEKIGDLKRDSHTEIVKLKLEYDEKLLKAQKNQMKHVSNASTNVNNDIFRKKLQFAKVQAEKDVNVLKKKITELERKLIQQSGRGQQDYPPSFQKRRRLSTFNNEM
ncbi:coiled-coil domain-containing protein 152-like [Xenia sp. Carnegie-2017]|uniref:coiled-coil domain-containing protein 152-like n=1 Tax=Xenia sp. Carnegie-2017 TaxID=2897299 RepID=UPI001F04CD13|nr:coiled-coil domain-containing protein 152-like [Xenia sp. Carnegie-2017]